MVAYGISCWYCSKIFSRMISPTKKRSGCSLTSSCNINEIGCTALQDSIWLDYACLLSFRDMVRCRFAGYNRM